MLELKLSSDDNATTINNEMSVQNNLTFVQQPQLPQEQQLIQQQLHQLQLSEQQQQQLPQQLQQQQPQISHYENGLDLNISNGLNHQLSQHEQQHEQQQQQQYEKNSSPSSPPLQPQTPILSPTSQALKLNLQLQPELKPHLEPVNRGEPVEKVQAPDTAKAMRQLFESGRLSEKTVAKTVPDINFEIQTPGSGVFENEPIRLEGVIRSDDFTKPEEELQSVSTKSKLDDYLEKSKVQFVINREPVTLSEEDGKVLENAPTVRTDVIREQDQSEAGTILPQEGQTKALKQKWMTMNNEFVKENKPIKLVEREDERSVIENQPEVRRDVLREEDDPMADENELLKRGLTSHLKSYWTNYKDKDIFPKTNPVVMPTSDGKTSFVLENDPIVLDNVAREQDLSRFEVDNIEKGQAKNLTNKWLSMEEKYRPKEFFNMESDLANSKNAGVFENKPEVVRDDVVRCDEIVQDMVIREGVAKNLSEKFKDSEFWDPKSPKSPPVLELAEGPSVYENEPSALHPNIIRCDADSDHLTNLRQGITADLVNKWKRQDLVGADLTMPDKSYFNEPGKLLLKEKATDSGVYENKPDVRRDVFREDDSEPEMISASKTRNLRSLWSKMGEEGPKKTGVPKQIRFTPPRDKSPPSTVTSPQVEYKSVHQNNYSEC